MRSSPSARRRSVLRQAGDWWVSATGTEVGGGVDHGDRAFRTRMAIQALQGPWERFEPVRRVTTPAKGPRASQGLVDLFLGRSR